MNINSLIEYIEKNFRRTLYRMDYEILEDIEKANYSEQQIKDAVAYCIEHHVDSLRYLEKVLINMKQDKQVINKPSWLDMDIKAEKCSEEELKELEELFKEFMED